MNPWPAYPAYKDAGVEWMEKIPVHWTVKKLKYVLNLSSGESPPGKMDKSQGGNPIYGANGIIGYCNSGNLKDKALVIGRVGSSGEINIAPPNSWVSDNALIVKLDDSGIAFRYAYYLLNAAHFGKWASRNAQPLITATLVRNWFFSSPPLSEQRAIATFLDQETAKLDALTHKFEQLLDRLEERRAALISHAVTKGLDPDAEMKDSGIPWLGEIPAHWGVRRLKLIANVQSGVAKGRNLRGETVEIPYLRVANVQSGFVDLSDVATLEIGEDEIDRYLLQYGDILMTEGGDYDKLGRGTVWAGQIDPCIHQNHIFAVRAKDSIDPYWISTITQADYARHYFILRSKKSTNLASISATNIMELPVVLPPAKEQQALLSYLDRETTKLDVLTDKIHVAIDRLDEYRTALIAAAVTGKIDVRNEVGCTSEVRPTWARPT
jgi:type I restriction enzyme S subunit